MRVYVPYARNWDGQVLLGRVAHGDPECVRRHFKSPPAFPVGVIGVEGPLADFLAGISCPECLMEVEL